MTELTSPHPPRLFTCQVERIPIKHLSKADPAASHPSPVCLLPARAVEASAGAWGSSRGVIGGSQSPEEAAPSLGCPGLCSDHSESTEPWDPSRTRRRLLIPGSSRLWRRDCERVQRSPPSLIGRPPCSCSCWRAPTPSGLPLAFPQGGTQALPPAASAKCK